MSGSRVSMPGSNTIRLGNLSCQLFYSHLCILRIFYVKTFLAGLCREKYFQKAFRFFWKRSKKLKNVVKKRYGPSGIENVLNNRYGPSGKKGRGSKFETMKFRTTGISKLRILK